LNPQPHFITMESWCVLCLTTNQPQQTNNLKNTTKSCGAWTRILVFLANPCFDLRQFVLVAHSFGQPKHALPNWESNPGNSLQRHLRQNRVVKHTILKASCPLGI